MFANSGKKIKNILIVAITRLGDMLQSTPTLVGLKAQNPGARITVLIEKQFATVCAGIPGVDEVYVVDLGYLCRCLHRENDGIVEGYKYIEEVVRDLRERKFDCSINMSNSSYTALLLKMIDAEINTGWLADAEGFRLMADPWAMLFAAFVYHQNRDFNCLNLVDIFRCAAGVSQHPRGLCFNVSDSAKSFARRFLEESGLGDTGPLVFVQAGASQAKRQWGPERFARLNRILVEQLGARVVYTGSGGERPLIEEILSLYSHRRIVTSAGRTNFDQLAALLKEADVLITGDTGPMHLSVAVGTPVVAMFLASALCFETGPYSAGNLIMQVQMTCSPCNPNFPCTRPDCHERISPELVAYLTQLRLSTPQGREVEMKVPASVASPSSVSIYRTDFDQDGFLTFTSINGTASYHGQKVGYFESARQAYAALWKEEFAGVPFCALSPEAPTEYPMLHPSLVGLRQALQWADEGERVIDQLVEVIKDVNSSSLLLGELGSRQEQIDKDLESISLAYPLIGALVRIFIMEKENMRGSDALMLAQETKELYRRLKRRGRRFWQLFEYYGNQYLGDSA